MMQTQGSVQTRVLLRDSPFGKPRPFIESMNINTSSHGAPWDDAIIVEQSLMPPSRMISGYIDRTTIVLPLVNEDVLATRVGGETQADEGSLKGVVHIDPSGSLTGASWSEPLNMLFLMPSDTTFERIYQSLPRNSFRIELARASFIHDVHIRQIGLAILEECKGGFSSGRLYGESLAMALTARLIQCYSAQHPLAPSNEGLPSWRLQRVMDFVERHIDAEIGLAEMAAAAGFSDYHFSRMFKQSTGLSPYRYVLERRVAHAKELLLNSQMPIKEISIQSGFSDQAHLTTVFKKQTGLTPAKFRSNAQ